MILRHVSVLVVLGALAAATGLVREVALAHFFGTGAEADAFSLTLYYVEAFTVVFVTGIGGYALIPVVAGLDRTGDLDAAHRLAEALILWTLLLGLPLLVLAFVWPSGLAHLVAPGFSRAQDASLRALMPAAVGASLCLAVSGIGVGLVQARGRFAGPPLGRSAFNLLVAGLLVLAAGRFGIVAGGIGLVLGGLAQLAVVGGAMAGAGWRPRRPVLWHPAVAQTLEVGAPVFLTLFATNIAAGGIQRALASSLPEGALSALNFAYRALTLVSLFTVSFATVSMTDLAGLFQREGQGPALLAKLQQHLDFSLFVSVPLGAWLWYSAAPVVDVLFRRGRYDEVSAAVTASCLGYLAIAVVPGAVLAVLQRACTALLLPWRALAGGVAFLVVLVGATALLLGRLGVQTLALSYTAAMLAACVCTALLLPQSIAGRVSIALARSTVTALARAAVGIGVAALVTPPLVSAFAFRHAFLQKCLEAAVAAAAIGVSYMAAAWMGKDPIILRAAGLVRRRQAEAQRLA